MKMQVLEKQGLVEKQEQGQAELAVARGEIESLQQQVAEAEKTAEERAGLRETHSSEVESLRWGYLFSLCLKCSCLMCFAVACRMIPEIADIADEE